jgi:hypothetical protein
MDKVGGALDAVQGRLLRAKLDALRFNCHSDTSIFPQSSLLAEVDHVIVRLMYVHG